MTTSVNSNLIFNMLKGLLALSSIQILSACSLDATLQSMNEAPSQILESKASNEELVSASQQHVTTAQGYNIQSSTSFHNAKSEVVTAKGYTVYTSVQSTFFKK